MIVLFYGLLKGLKMVYAPVTILSENENGQIGYEEYDSMTEDAIKIRIFQLEKEGWAVQAIQVGEAQYDMDWTHLLIKE